MWRAAEGALGALVKLGLLSGMRRGELADLRWDDILDDRIVLSAAMTKTATTHEIPLTPLMREILKRRPHTISPLVFPSYNGRRLCGWSEHMARLVPRAGVGPWTLHDLRRTCRTLMSRCGVPEPAAELAIGHVKATLVAILQSR